MGHRDYPWIERDACGTCGSARWRVIDTPHGRVARCEACLPRLGDGERTVERITLRRANSKPIGGTTEGG